MAALRSDRRVHRAQGCGVILAQAQEGLALGDFIGVDPHFAGDRAAAGGVHRPLALPRMRLMPSITARLARSIACSWSSAASRRPS